MSRRGDNIHKRKDGRWEGRYKYGFKENGIATYRSVYGKTYTECKNKLEEMKKSSSLLPDAKSPELNFSEILVMWQASNRIRIKGATENKYSWMIEKHILPEFGNKKVVELSSTVINLFLDKKIKEGSINNSIGLSPSYVKTMAIIIESALNFAVSEKLCEPLKITINKPIIPKNEVHILTIETQQYLENVLHSDRTKVALGTLIALYTGLRIGEICALRWDDIDFDEDVIFVRHTITRVKSSEYNQKTMLIIDTPKTPTSKRIIPILSTLKPYLKISYENRVSEFVISDNEKFVGTRTFDYRFRQMLKKYKINVFSFHTIRHTFASRCIEAGMDVKTLSEILGHSSVSTTLNIYVHSSMKMKKEQIEKIATSS